jgi:hypothetical protein
MAVQIYISYWVDTPGCTEGFVKEAPRSGFKKPVRKTADTESGGHFVK